MKYNKGKSGNYNGRPKGTGHRQQLFNIMVSPHKEVLFEKAVELAKSGNEAMLKFFLERLSPARPADETVEFNLPDLDMTKPESIMQLGAEVLKIVSTGKVTPEQGKAYLSMLELHRKNIELFDISNRIAVLENNLMEGKKTRQISLN